MRNRNRSNVLLVEILIAVLFFMLSATVLMRVFGTSRNLTVRSGVESVALAQAQNLAETLYAAGDIEQALAEQGFRSSHGAWSRNKGEYTLYVMGESAPTDAGELWTGTISVYYNLNNPDDPAGSVRELFSLPCTRYKGGVPA